MTHFVHTQVKTTGPQEIKTMNQNQVFLSSFRQEVSFRAAICTVLAIIVGGHTGQGTAATLVDRDLRVKKGARKGAR